MHSEGKTPNFVFFDLSKLDTASASAFLADRAQKTGSEALSPLAPCHWILTPQRFADLQAASGPGPDFLRLRLKQDRLVLTNPTGFDWNHLFPSEAEQEFRAVGEEGAALFLENSAAFPEWVADLNRTVFSATPRGLCVAQGSRVLCVSWASPQNPHGVWWVVPGRALFSTLPPQPWGDLIGALPGLSASRGTEPGLLPPSPAEKTPLVRIAALRRSPATPTQLSVLFRSADYPGLGDKDVVDFDEALGGIRKRSLVANMQGQTDLAEGAFKVRFQGGRLTRIEDGKGVLCSGSQTFLEWGGKRHLFTVNSAFSFEGDYSWGLRQSLVLGHDDFQEPGRAVCDYFFVEESREFFVSVTIRWPRWKTPVTVTAWAPLELSLFERSGDPLTTRAVWPDGKSASRIHRRGTSGTLSGTDFLFSAGQRALAFGFPQNQTPRPHVLPWKRLSSWGRPAVVLNPEGGYHPRPSAEFDGVEEHFSFYLASAEGAKIPFSVTRKQAIELIPPYVDDPAHPVSHS